MASMALDLLAGSVVFQIPHRPNSRLNIRMGLHSGPATGVVAGSKIPNYCVLSKAANVAKIVDQVGRFTDFKQTRPIIGRSLRIVCSQFCI